MEIEVTVHGLMPDPHTDQQILVLKPKNHVEGNFLPIWIGPSEANSIRLALEETLPGRPLTHDLLKDILGYFKIPVSKVVICKMIQGTYFANLHLKNRSGELTIDSRPSDAVALAVRLKAPIFIEEEIYLKLKQQTSLSTKRNVKNINVES